MREDIGDATDPGILSRRPFESLMASMPKMMGVDASGSGWKCPLRPATLCQLARDSLQSRLEPELLGIRSARRMSKRCYAMGAAGIRGAFGNMVFEMITAFQRSR